MDKAFHAFDKEFWSKHKDEVTEGLVPIIGPTNTSDLSGYRESPNTRIAIPKNGAVTHGTRESFLRILDAKTGRG